MPSASKVVVHTTYMSDKEIVFWKHVFCAAAERCRMWKHKESCKYVTADKIPVSCEDEDEYLCSCGLGVFPKGYLADSQTFAVTKENAVRVALPLVFASPISPVAVTEGDYDLVKPNFMSRFKEILSAALGPTSAGDQAQIQAQAPKCLSCGRDKCKDGKDLRRCTRCGVTRYCSRDCQRGDWKDHKKICAEMANMIGDDQVAQ